MKFALLRDLLPLVAVLAVVGFVVRAMEPPAARPVHAPASDFSAGRALAHVREVARAPHPPGSVEHGRVRDYLVRQFAGLGLQTRVQQTIAWRPQAGYVQAAQVENVIARLPGRGAGKAVMLAAHYDSHATGPGAGDDGAGVATLLETARALTTGEPPARDVLFVVTDAEEWGLIGAEGFVRDAPEARNVGGVLNFEARGGGGPVFMFETSNGNASLISAFGQSTSRPLASSLMYSLYKLLPNDTDLSVFKEAGLPGLNFAFAAHWTHYHTALDTPDKLDARSVQHEGDLALAAARRLSQAKSLLSSGDAAYFDVLSRYLVRYPLDATPFLVGIALILLVAATLRGRKEDGFLRGWSIGIAVFPVTLVVGGVTAYLLGLAIAPLRDRTPWRDPYDARLLEVGLFAVSVGLVWGCWAMLPARFGARPLLLGALVWWAGLSCLTAVLLPGAAYLFLWPLITLCAASLLRSVTPLVAVGLLSLVLTVPVLHGIALLLGFGLPPGLGILAAVCAAPLVPLLRGAKLPYLAPAALLLAGIVTVGAAFVRNTPSADQPRTNTLLYFLDTSAEESNWVSADTKNDVWTAPFLRDAQPIEGTRFFPWTQRPLRFAPAPRLALPAPEVIQQGRLVTIRSRRGAQEMAITGSYVRSVSLNGKPLPLLPPVGQRDGFCLRFLAPPPGGIMLEIEATSDAALVVDDYAYGLPPGTPPRPSMLIAQPLSPFTDRTIVRTRAALAETDRLRLGPSVRNIEQ